MRRIFRFYFLFAIPFFLIRLATIAETDLSTGFFFGSGYGRFLYFSSLVVAFVVAASAYFRTKRKGIVPAAPEAPPLFLQICLCLAALFSLQQLLIPPLTSQITSRVLSVSVFVLFAAAHLFSAAFFFILAANKSLPSSVLSDMFASAPAIAFTAQMLFLYAQKPVNLHDSLTVLSLLCEAVLAIGWLRFCSAVLAGSSEAFPSAVFFSILAFYLSICFRLPEVFVSHGAPSFLRIISILHHAFCSVVLIALTVSSIPDKRTSAVEED